MATQKEVARLAGVSQATVSMALSGSGKNELPEATIAKIKKAVSVLGYSPNRSAQALRTNRSRTIACLIPDITNPFYPALVRGVQMAAEESGYDVITINTDGSRERELHFLKLAQEGRVDGFIGTFFGITAADLEGFKEREVPIVRLETGARKIHELPVDDVFVDNFSAIRDVTEYLIGKGHSRIAMISGTGGPQIARVDGYMAAIAAAGLTPNLELVEAFTEDSGELAVDAVFKRDHPPTAIVAANDLLAIGVLRALKKMGLSIPDDVAVTGFDNIPASAQVTPSLTTVDRFQADLGAIAVRLLLQRLNGASGESSQTIQGKYKLIERGST